MSVCPNSVCQSDRILCQGGNIFTNNSADNNNDKAISV